MKPGLTPTYALTLLLSVEMSGCVALVAGTHQDIAFESAMPRVTVTLDGKQSCEVPCTLNVRRQWAAFNMIATQDGAAVAEGPIYRRHESSVGGGCMTDSKEWSLWLATMGDALLLVPFIVDVSMGLQAGYQPERVVIEKSRYLVDDQCFAKPHVGGLGQGFKGDGQE